MPELMAGLVVIGTRYLALEWVLAAFNLTDEATLDAYWHGAEFASAQPAAKGTRVWVRIKHPRHPDCWISHDPGEFRTTPPEEPCLIVDLPDGGPRTRCRDILAALLEPNETGLPINDNEQKLLDVGNRLLKGATNSTETAFKRELSATIDLPRDDFIEPLNQLYRQGLFGFQCQIDQFGFWILLLQMQRALGVRIQQDWLADESAVFFGFMHEMLTDASRRDQCISYATEIARSEYDHGRAGLAKALDAETMGSMPRHLMLALHRFQMALWLIHALSKGGVDKHAIGLNAIVVEEAQVCTMSAITQGARFFTRKPESEARFLLSDALPTHDALRRRARKSASEILPVFTRFFADVLAAQALTLIDNVDQIRGGIAELERLDARLPLMTAEFERGWIHHALLRANKRLNDNAAVDKLAKVIAGELTVRVVLGRQYRSEQR